MVKEKGKGTPSFLSAGSRFGKQYPPTEKSTKTTADIPKKLKTTQPKYMELSVYQPLFFFPKEPFINLEKMKYIYSYNWNSFYLSKIYTSIYTPRLDSLFT